MCVGIACTLSEGLVTYPSTFDTMSNMTCLGSRYRLISSMSSILSRAFNLSLKTLSRLKAFCSRLLKISNVAISVHRLSLRLPESRRRFKIFFLVRRTFTPFYETQFSPFS